MTVAAINMISVIKLISSRNDNFRNSRRVSSPVFSGITTRHQATTGILFANFVENAFLILKKICFYMRSISYWLFFNNFEKMSAIFIEKNLVFDRRNTFYLHLTSNVLVFPVFAKKFFQKTFSLKNTNFVRF